MALEGSGAILGADFLATLVVVVDHIDDLLLRYPLVPESWGPKKGTHVHKPVFMLRRGAACLSI